MIEILRLALRGLLRSPRRALLPGATVVIGVAAILFCKAYLDGLERVIIDFVVKARAGALQVERRGYGSAKELAPLDLDLPATGPLAQAIAATPAVRGVTPRLVFAGLVSNGVSTTALAAIGVDPAGERVVCPEGPGGYPAEWMRGPGLRDPDADEVVIGEGLAKAFGVKLGEQITLLVTTRGGSLDTADVTITGIYPFPDPYEDMHLVVVPLLLAQRLVHMPDRATAFAVAVHDLEAIPVVQAAMNRALAHDDPPVDVQRWDELAPYFRDVVAQEHDLMSVVLAIVFLLVVAGIVNTMLMSVMERTREIGTFLALGFRRRRILALFLVESVVLTAVASTIGIALGAGLVALVAKSGITFDLPGAGLVRVFPRFNAAYVGWSLLAAIAGGLVGGLLPARRAARMRPIEALRAV